MTWSERLGRVGIWAGVTAIDAAAAQRVEGMGFGTVWQGGSPAADLTRAEELLAASSTLQVATGIVNIWKADPAELAASFHRIEARFPGRLLLGIGSGHREATPERTRPIDAMSRYLDVLDAEGVGPSARVLSALGPRMLQLARERSAGTHPYLTVPAQTREQRELLGPDALIAPEQTVVLDDDPVTARETARRFLSRYLAMANYRTTILRGGFDEADVEHGGSDALVDAIVAHGTAGVVAASVTAHLEAGADHVCVQVQPADAGMLDTLAVIAEELRLAP